MKLLINNILLVKNLWFTLLLCQLAYANAEQPSIVKKIEQKFENTAVGAVAYVLVEGDKIVAEGGFGQYSNENPKQVTENSLFRIGSITKTFTAIAVMHQLERGKLKLHQSIKSYLADIPLNNRWRGSPVTVEMLLEHTSGLQDLSREEFIYPVPLSLTKAFQIAPQSRQVKWKPGYHFSYTNAGAGYLGRVIEVINKTDYDDWFETEILLAMGMRSSSLRWSKTLEQQLVTGYDSDLKTSIPYWHTLFRPFGGLNTTARDMGHFLLLFTSERIAEESDKQIISAYSLKRMETPTTSLAAKAGLKTGYGLAIRNELESGHRIYSHGGDGDGYLAHFAYSKESRRGYFVVINAFRHDIKESFTDTLNHWLIEEIPQQELTPGINKTQLSYKNLELGEMKKLVGEYEKITSRFSRKTDNSSESIFIKIDSNLLYRCYKKYRQCKKIEAVTEELFRIGEHSNPSMAIVKADDGFYYLQLDSENYRKR